MTLHGAQVSLKTSRFSNCANSTVLQCKAAQTQCLAIKCYIKHSYCFGHNSIHEEINSRLKSKNACYHSVQNLGYCSLLSKNIKIKIYRIIIWPVVLYECATWSLTLREERRLKVFENRVLRRISGAKRDAVTGEWRKLHNEELNDLY